MKIAILGYGSQGVSALEYFRNADNQITVCDLNTDTEVPEGIDIQAGENYLKNLDQFDLIVRSPSVHPKDIVSANPYDPTILERVTTNTNIFLENCPTKNIIGITGTKGKGTTSTLITHILTTAGFKVHLGGNIGIAPLEMLKDDICENDWVVLELANFQLIDIKYSPKIAVCLMIAAEHMDWHENLNEYITAKQQLFRWQTADSVAVYFADNQLSVQIVSPSRGKKIPYYKEPGAHVQGNKIYIEDTKICDVEDIKLLGRHNWQNVCAAVTAVWQITKDVESIERAIQTVNGLPFRLELIRELNGVKYYNDSFGTTPETAIVAIQAFQEPKVVILGGSNKSASYDDLAHVVRHGNVRAVITIGSTGPSIANSLRSQGFDNIIQGGLTMPELVNQAKNIAQSGDVILLSTGCASFGMFKNYKDRGEQFNRAVRSLNEAA